MPRHSPGKLRLIGWLDPATAIGKNGKILPAEIGAKDESTNTPRGPHAQERSAPGRLRIRIAGRGRGRSGLQHLDDRIPGNPDRSLLCRPDGHVDLSAHRQLRHAGPGRTGKRASGRGADHSGALIGGLELRERGTARFVPESQRHRWDRGHRHAGTGPPSARGGNDERDRLDRGLRCGFAQG